MPGACRPALRLRGVTEKVRKVKKFQDVQQHLLQNRYHWLVTDALGFIGPNMVGALHLDQRLKGTSATDHRHNPVPGSVSHFIDDRSQPTHRIGKVLRQAMAWYVGRLTPVAKTIASTYKQ